MLRWSLGGGAVFYERGTPVPVPKRVCQSRGWPISHEAGLSVSRRAHLSRGGSISAGAGVRRRVTRAHNLSTTRARNLFTAILCTVGLDVIGKEAWPFYRTSFGVRQCGGLEEPKGPRGHQGARMSRGLATCPSRMLSHVYGGRAGGREACLVVEVLLLGGEG